MRHPELHQNPEVIDMQMTRRASAKIELAQHDDGRWMWATSWAEGFSGRGYACAAKWGRFAPTRQAALEAAIAEAMEQTARASSDCPNVREWLESLWPRQGDMFMPANVKVTGLRGFSRRSG